MSRALSGYSAWITGLRRADSATRANAPLISYDDTFSILKANPLADWTDDQLQAYIDANDVVVNPLVHEGYPSIGCAPCTSIAQEGADPRSGRWAGQAKTECGLHAT
jgi:phosphoadenosine phosphosulfate reductase